MNNEWFFNIASWGYDTLTHQDVWREQIASVLEHVADPTSIRRVLDLGCGPGVSAFVLADRLPGARVEGVDIAPKMISRAEQHHRQKFNHLDNVSFSVGDATALPFGDGSFDFAVGHSFLYLVPDRIGVLREIRRLLGDGGTLVLMEPNRRGSLRDAAARSFGRELGSAGAIDATRFRTSMLLWRLVSGNVGRLEPTEVVDWMREAGFDMAATVPTLGGLGMHCVGRVRGI